MKTAKELRVEFYGEQDARAYDHDEIYIMEGYAEQWKKLVEEDEVDMLIKDNEIERLKQLLKREQHMDL